MAFTITGPVAISEGDGSAKLITWATGTTGDTGTAVELPEWADNCVQIVGTIGGATIVIEGSNDGTNYNTLNAASTGALSFTAVTDAMKQIIERPRFIRPKITGGAGVSLSVYLLMRRANPMRT